MKILVVDDDPEVRECLRDALLISGHEPVLAGDGVEALGVLAAGDCRVVVTDWHMPGMNGVDLVRAIRRADFGGYVYVLMLTSNSGTPEIVEALSAGADDFLRKPFHPTELMVRLQTAERIVGLEMRDLLIFAMAKLAESRDPDGGDHLERVRHYSRLLAEELSGRPRHRDEVDPNYVRMIYLTSPLHDIGKVGIPDAVLMKPGRLTGAEYELMKSHTTIGAETLDAAMAKYPHARYLKMASQIALNHHEWFDGTGYPNGLGGDDIPLCGRIVALADVYDALTTARRYKGALHHDLARASIVQATGTQFDPDVVNAFLAAESRFVEIGKAHVKAA